MKKIPLFAFGLIVTMHSGWAEASLLAQPATKPETTQKSAAEAVMAKPPASFAGKVLETMDASGYTYVNLETGGKTMWVALPATKVTVGEEIEVWSGTQMGRFSSKTLKKTFEEINFSPGLVTKDKPKLPHQPAAAQPQADQAHPEKAASPQQKSHGMTAQPAPGMTAISGKVVETMDSGGYTYVYLENDGKKAWAAMPVTPVKVGQQLTLQPGAKMDNFSSKSLNKTFDSVIFSGGIISETK